MFVSHQTKQVSKDEKGQDYITIKKFMCKAFYFKSMTDIDSARKIERTFASNPRAQATQQDDRDEVISKKSG